MNSDRGKGYPDGREVVSALPDVVSNGSEMSSGEGSRNEDVIGDDDKVTKIFRRSMTRHLG